MNKQKRKDNGQYDENEKPSRRPEVITFVSIVAISMFAVWFLPKVAIVNNYVKADTITATTTEYVDMTPEKIKKVQDKLLDELSLGCEVKGSTEPDGVLILDSNNKMSIGRFQFQITTVQHYVKQFENKDISKHDAIVLALDATEAKELARKIVFEVKGGVEANWFNCNSAHQLQTQVNVISEFMKL